MRDTQIEFTKMVPEILILGCKCLAELNRGIAGHAAEKTGEIGNLIKSQFEKNNKRYNEVGTQLQ